MKRQRPQSSAGFQTADPVTYHSDGNGADGTSDGGIGKRYPGFSDTITEHGTIGRNMLGKDADPGNSNHKEQ